VNHWILPVALVAAPVTVLETGNGPVLEVVLRDIAENSLRKGHGVGVGGRTAKIGLCPLEAFIEGLVES
jgi:hypothetical protein